MDRFDELRRRLAYAIEQLDLRARVEEHPWELVGAAALLGAWLGFAPPRVKLTEAKTLRGRIADSMLAAIGAIAVRLVREAALHEVGEVAKQWWQDASRGKPPREPAAHPA